jgi:hypothetical protein
MSHGSATASADRLRPITGSPTLTTDPSTKARLDARIVAAKTSCGFATAALASMKLRSIDRAAAASQVMWMVALILVFPAWQAIQSTRNAKTIQALSNSLHLPSPQPKPMIAGAGLTIWSSYYAPAHYSAC